MQLSHFVGFQFQLATQQQDFFANASPSPNGEVMNSYEDMEPVPSSTRRALPSRIEDVMGGKTLRSVDSILRQLGDRSVE